MHLAAMCPFSLNIEINENCLGNWNNMQTEDGKGEKVQLVNLAMYVKYKKRKQ